MNPLKNALGRILILFHMTMIAGAPALAQINLTTSPVWSANPGSYVSQRHSYYEYTVNRVKEIKGK